MTLEKKQALKGYGLLLCHSSHRKNIKPANLANFATLRLHKKSEPTCPGDVFGGVLNHSCKTKPQIEHRRHELAFGGYKSSFQKPLSASELAGVPSVPN